MKKDGHGVGLSAPGQLIGSCNDWNMSTAKRRHCFTRPWGGGRSIACFPST